MHILQMENRKHLLSRLSIYFKMLNSRRQKYVKLKASKIKIYQKFVSKYNLVSSRRCINFSVILFFIRILQNKMEYTQPIRTVDLFNNDLYQFTCSYSYFIQNKHEQEATFEIFFRKYPFNGEYVIFAGLESVKDFVRNFKFTEEHEKYLKSIFPHMKDEYFTWIKQDFSTKVTFRGMKEGEIVFANEPILSYTGPLGFVQMLQTPFLNLLGFASLVATNASRMVKAVYPKACLEFGTRRAQGPDGALSASQYAYIGGFTATSNVEAAQKLAIRSIGTMSHAYVTSFDSLDDVQPFFMGGVNMKERAIQIKKNLGFKTHEGELAAFLNFAQAFPENFTALIDSYSTLESGILNTIIVGTALIESGIKKIGIRLDSGDLGDLSKKCRKIWNKHVPQVRLTISASDDLHEERLIQLEKEKSEIDVYAIGTNIATCKKQPALGLVCKLVELNGVPKMKLSSTPEKSTLPCSKKVYRIITEDREHFDLIALESEIFNVQDEIQVGVLKAKHVTNKKISSVRLLNDFVDFTPVTAHQSRQYVKKSQKELPEKIFELDTPSNYSVLMTKGFMKRFYETLEKAEQKPNKGKQLLEENDPSSPSKVKIINA